ncbi:hypothetical protein [Halorussus halobius]|uniref:hypothetical protein n=1 Tax=Halorussus halobius TaxID=1710537 RepID=UPI001091F843|nr:hypothetical protein [Halorussus halobius]
MATSSSADSTEGTRSDDERTSRDEQVSHDGSAARADEDSASTLDRLETVARSVRLAFFGFVVALALVPAVALWAGATPFDAPPTRPYFAFVLAAVVGTAALIAVAVADA